MGGGRLARMVVALLTVAAPMLVVAAPARADGPGDIATWINSFRTGVGAPALALDSGLSSVAQQWANHMAATGALAHNPNLSTQAPQGWTKLGEDIGSGYSLRAVYLGLTTSQSATDLIDPAYNRTGFGVATDSKGQVWLSEVLGAYAPPAPSIMAFPTSGAVIFPSPQTFSWSQASGGLYYCLTVGTSKGGVDLVNTGLLSADKLSYPVAALPGGQLWARIYTFTQSAWIFSDVSFSVTGPSTATLTRPADGATNIDTTQPFTWSPVASASNYVLTVGTTKGGNELLSTGALPGTQTSYQVPALPANKKLWARLYSFIAGTWNHYVDVSFTAARR